MNQKLINSPLWVEGLLIKPGSTVKYNDAYYMRAFSTNNDNPEGNSDYIYIGEFKRFGVFAKLEDLDGFAAKDASNLDVQDIDNWRSQLGFIITPDASTASKGILQLAGDLRGIATNPLVQKVTSDGHVVNEGINWTTRTGGNQVIQVQATLDATTSTTDVAGGFMRFQTTGSNCNIDGLMIELSAGYTGDKLVRGINIHNRVAGGDTLDMLDESGTIGLSAQSQGGSTGDNIGVYSIAGFAQGRNIAGYFRAMQDPTGDVSDLNIGVLAYAGHHLPNVSNQIGGYFALGHDYQFAIQPNLLTSCALIADNGDFEHPIFKGKRYGYDVFEIKSKGEVELKPSHNNVIPLTITSLAGQSTNLAYMSIGGVEKWRVSSSGDTIMAGRLLFQESGGSTYAQALYCESGSNNVVLRCGPTANAIAIKKGDATSIGAVKGTSNTFIWGQAAVNVSSSLYPQDGMILQGDLDMSLASPVGIILKDTVLGTRHKITLTNGDINISSAL